MSKIAYSIRKDGRLMKRVTVNGKVKSIYAKTYSELEDKYFKLKFDDLKGLNVDKCNFKTYAEKWLTINSGGKSEATIKEYNYIINKYLIPTFGYMQLNKIKKYNIQELQSKLLSEEHFELAHKCVRYMKTILNDAIANDMLNKNPCFGIKEPKLEHKERKVLSSEEDKIILESSHKYADFFRILRYTGMRREEIAALTLNDVDLKNKTISINKAMSYATNQPKKKPVKNKEPRIVPILDIIYNDVVNRVEWCKENNIDYIFTKQTNIKEPLSQEAIRNMSSSFCKSVGFKFTPHELRHSYCTMLYYSGISIKETQNLMGHLSADMVYDLYAHLDKTKENTSNKVNEYINSLRV